MLARTVETLPEGVHWRYEPKWDGFRAIAERDGGRIRISSRSGRRLDARFPEVAGSLLAALPDATTLDGEIVRWSGEGLDFDALQRRNRASLSTAERLADEEPAHFIAFDLLRLTGADLTQSALAHRRDRLEKLFAGVHDPRLMLGWQTSRAIVARQWFDGLSGVGLEGLMVKDARRAYAPGRRDWLKFKRRITTEAIVGGVIGRTDRPSALILGRPDPASGQLRIAGRTAELTRAQQDGLSGLLREAGDDHPWPRRLAPAWGTGEPVVYVRVEPEVVVEVEPDPAVSAGRWRHVVPYLRPRSDVGPADVPTGLDLET
ncbi:ATP-dependent DNA ligase [Nocardiopsis sediminis]|uniref:ATP-dependent DNA ligase n=1 Tax=Nocardiopsis sediminis TaxID=1778267 RepID=A0ABV8FG64_9ACTN